ncbi:Conserved_hypothetical protein [Hexamita inflata]|uniref:Uncharacterized protein n=1 Tax=Hexamita inflata TaxID=28002 RepID=A0AA86QRX7_9EUKA|nr:Conserved hypothetical protein [Hexamita inflata]
MTTRLPPTKRQQISGIIEKGKNLQQKIQQSQDELSQHFSGDHKTDIKKNMPVTQQVPAPAITKNLSSASVQSQQPNYDLVIQKSKMQLDQLENLVRERKKSKTSMSLDSAQKPSMTETTAQAKPEEPKQPVLKIEPATTVLLDLHSLKFVSQKSISELQQQQIQFEVFSDAQGLLSQFTLNFKSEQSNMKHFNYEYQLSSHNNTMQMQINKQLSIKYIEGDGLTLKAKTKNFQLVQKYPILFKSQFTQLVQTQNKYYLSQLDVEQLNTQQPVLQINDRFNNAVLSEQTSLEDIMPVQIYCSAVVSSSAENMNQFIEPNLFLEQLIYNERLINEKTVKSAKQAKETQTEQSVQNLVKFGQGMLIDEVTGQVYSDPEYVEDKIQTQIAYQITQQNSFQNNQSNNSLQTNYYQQQTTLLNQQPIAEHPQLFIKKIELDCLPVNIQQISNIQIQFENQIQQIAQNVPVVNGHLLLHLQLVSFKVTRFQIPPLIIKADQFTSVVTLQELQTSTNIEKWNQTLKTGRCFISLSCLPPLVLNRNAKMYEFLGENGQILEKRNVQGINLQEKMNDKMTATQICQMYEQKKTEQQFERPNVDYNNNNYSLNNNQNNNQQINQGKKVEKTQGIEEIQMQLASITQQLSENSFNVSVGHEVKEIEEKKPIKQKKAPKPESPVQKSKQLATSLSTSDISNQVEQRLKRNIKTQQRDDNDDLSDILNQSLKEQRQAQNKQRLETTKKNLDVKKILGESLLESQIQEVSAKKISKQVKSSRNTKYNNIKYDISDSDEDNVQEKISILKQEPKQRQNTDWLRKQAEKLFINNQESDDSSDI